MKKIIVIFILLIYKNSFSQKAYIEASYIGFIDKYPITFHIVSGDIYFGWYYYNKYTQKIKIESDYNTTEAKKVIVYEYQNNKKTAYFIFNDINMDDKILIGTWHSIDEKNVYKVSLKKN